MDSVSSDGIDTVYRQGRADVTVSIQFCVPLNWTGESFVRFDPVEQKFIIILRNVERPPTFIPPAPPPAPPPPPPPPPASVAVITNGDHRAAIDPVPDTDNGDITPLDLSQN